jgi:hypothetical protein
MAAEIQAQTEVAQADALTEFSQVSAILSVKSSQTSTLNAEVPAESVPDQIAAAIVEPAVESLTPLPPSPVEETSVSLAQPSDASLTLNLATSAIAQPSLEADGFQPLADLLEVSQPTTPSEARPNLNQADSLLAQQASDASSDTTIDSTSILEQINRYSNDSDGGDSNALNQVTNVSQLSDVSPGDWAYEALRVLVERYGCIAGYSDGTFRGNRALTRYEFAAGLNACLQQVERLIASSTADFVTKQDLETLQRLVEEFRAELTTSGTRVGNLEGRVAFLEDHQFSTTTKLNGEVIFALADLFGGQAANGVDLDTNSNTVFFDRVRLNFDTSFTGKDRLRTRLEAGNFIQFDALSSGRALNVTREGRLGFESFTGDGNDIIINDLYYSFPLGDAATVRLIANGGKFEEVVNVLNPGLNPSGTGVISRFGRYSPIYRIGYDAARAAGAVLTFGPKSPIRVDLGYLSDTAADLGEDSGIFNGNYSALGQVTFQPSKAFSIAATYVHSYNNDNLSTGTGSIASQLDVNRPIVGNSYGVEASFSFSPQLILSGWAALTEAVVLGLGNADVWTYGATLSINDLGTKGSTLGFVVGMEPKLTGSDRTVGAVLGRREDPNSGLHVEGFYKFRLTDNILITPGVIWLTAPGHDENNADIFVGTLRTTFTF